jgi:acyl-CoA thioesterase-1
MAMGNRFVAMVSLIAISALAACSSPAPPRTAPSTPVAAGAPAADGRSLIVAFGDSLTAGLGVGPDQNYPAKLQERIDREGFPYRVVNEGVSGETSAQGLARATLIREMRPSVVILEFGANDGLRGIPVEVTRSNLDRMIQDFVADGARVVIAGMEVPPNYGPAYTSSFRAVYSELAKRHHAPLIPVFLAGVGGVPELNQGDGIHPTPRGYDLVVENVWKVLVPLLVRS